LNPNDINWDEEQFGKYDWKDFYHEAVEAVPPKAPTLQRKFITDEHFL
jgi:hypothetical protein